MKFMLQTVAAKIETTYGTDSVPTTAANLVAVENVDLNPLEMNTDDYTPVSNTFAKGAKIIGSRYATVSFDVLLAGGGTPPGTRPNHGVLNRMCAMSEVVAAGTSVTYAPISDDEESGTLYFWWHKVRQRLLGARGTRVLRAGAGRGIRLGYSFTGLQMPMTDETPSGLVLPTPPRPLAMSQANTTMTLDGYQVRVSDLTIDLGNDVKFRDHTNRRTVEVMDRTPTGKITFELPTVAEKDFLGASGFVTLGTVAAAVLTHGTTAGNICTINLGAVQCVKPKPRNQDGLIVLECDLHLSGNPFTEVYT